MSILSKTTLSFNGKIRRIWWKTKEQKQEEIRQNFLQRLHAELSGIENPNERQMKKIALLKVFAKELEFNLFFDKEEVKTLIQELANY